VVEDGNSAMKMWRRRWVAESKHLLSCSLRDSRTSHHGYHPVSCSCLRDSRASCHLSYWTQSSSCVLSLSLSLSLSSALTVDIQHLPCYFPRRYFLMGLLLDGFVWQFSFRFWADILLSQFSSSHRYLLLTLGSRDSLCKSV
jgi:hypothetical protein